MSEKIYLTIPIDEDFFFKFSKAVKQKGNGKSINEMLEQLMQRYVNDPPPVGPDVEKLLAKYSNFGVGQLANIVLRELLERGVATDYEITEFQKASGGVQVEKFGISNGQYVKKTFGLSFPLLVTEEKFQKDQIKFYTKPLNIDGNKYHLCSQWVEGQHRKKLEAWIKKSLPEWFERTDEYRRNEMITWIEYS